MKWEMEMGMEEGVEVVLERIWELHDRISDAIHAISRAHFLKSVRDSAARGGKVSGPEDGDSAGDGGGGGGGRSGFVFVKGWLRPEDEAVLAEARSLNAIRSALENVEDQLEFFHMVQLQQRAERGTAIERLEQSRVILAMRLAEHQGKEYQVIEEARAFVGDVHDTAARFVSQENLFDPQESLRSPSRFVIWMAVSSLQAVRRSLGLESLGCAVGSAALFAVSMFAFLQLHRAAFDNDGLARKRDRAFGEAGSWGVSSLRNGPKDELDVLAARG